MKLRILLSYWYYKDADLDGLFETYFKDNIPDIFADSGAFSAMTQGVGITVKEYVDWVKRWQHLFSAYSVLDVIKNAEETWENQKKMEKAGLNPLPAFHVLEDFKWLEKYVKKYPYIALGVAGMQSRKDALMAWLVKCFKIAGDQSVFHGFALTSWKVMSSFSWYSVDSSSWGSGFRYGRVPLFDSHKGRFHIVTLGTNEPYRHADLITFYGFDPADFADRSKNDRAKICAISALSYMQAEKYLRNKFGEIYIPTKNGQGGDGGLHLHLADANPTRFIETQKGVNLYLADTSSLKHNFHDANVGLNLYLAEIMPDLKDVRSIGKHGKDSL